MEITTFRGSCPFWGSGSLKSFSNQLSELIFETELLSKLIIAPKLNMSR